MRQPTPERGYLWKFKNKNLWEFMALWWSFMTKRKIHVMNIFVSFMNIYDHSQREAQNHLWTFVAHWWSFLTKKQKTFTTKQCFTRQPNPERDYLWNFKKNNSWTFMAHWWTFMTKKHSWLPQARSANKINILDSINIPKIYWLTRTC